MVGSAVVVVGEQYATPNAEKRRVSPAAQAEHLPGPGTYDFGPGTLGLWRVTSYESLTQGAVKC